MHRYAKANNPYIPHTYDSTKPNNYISYFDANNLYGWSIIQHLPKSNYKWNDNITLEAHLTIQIQVIY